MEETFRTLTFTAPSGNQFTIREQNGADDDVLSNSHDAKTLMNLSKFLSGIIIDTSLSGKISGKLNPQEVHNLPVLDKYCIILNSRILSLGQEFEFSYKWLEGLEETEVFYTQDLGELLFNYENREPEIEELLQKPDAIPYYPGNETVDIPIVTTSGKKLKFDLLTTDGEATFANLPVEKQTKNSALVVRNLMLDVNGKYERVTNFSMFSVKDMYEIRTQVNKYDPTYYGLITLNNPKTNETIRVPFMALTGFFYLGEE